MEEFFGLTHFGALEVADFRSQALDAAGNNRQSAEEGSMTVARDNLRGNGLGLQAQPFGHKGFNPRVEMGIGANGTGNGAGCDFGPCGFKALAVAGKLSVVPGQLQAERGRLGMNTMAAPDGERVLVFKRAGLECGQNVIQILEQQVGSLHELHGQAGIQHIGRGHAQMHEAAFRPDFFSQPCQEGNDIVAGFGLDLVDPGEVGLGKGGHGGVALLAHNLGGILGNRAVFRHASQASASISNQMR